MTPSRTSSQKLEPHTVAKHRILKDYLGQWFGIVGHRFHRAVYIDGFSAAGASEDGVPGSPTLALEHALYHQDLFTDGLRLIFVEKDDSTARELRGRIATFEQHVRNRRKFQIEVLHGTFADAMLQRLSLWENNASHRYVVPILAFVDPFGYSGIPFNVISRLLALPSSEVFVNIMVDYVNRFLEHPNKKITDHIVEAYGTTDVLSIRDKPGRSVENLLAFYDERLREHTAAKHILRFDMVNRIGHVLYSLFFATQSPVGLSRMKDSMWSVDPSGDFVFRDPRDEAQLRLTYGFEHTQLLAQKIASRFAEDRSAEVKDISNYVEVDTIYLDTHMRDALRHLVNAKKAIVKPRKSDGSTYRHGFPMEAIIEFT